MADGKDGVVHVATSLDCVEDIGGVRKYVQGRRGICKVRFSSNFREVVIQVEGGPVSWEKAGLAKEKLQCAHTSKVHNVN